MLHVDSPRLTAFAPSMAAEAVSLCTSYFPLPAMAAFLCKHVKERQYIALFCIFLEFSEFSTPQIWRFRGKGLTLRRSFDERARASAFAPPLNGCNHSGAFCFLYLQYLNELCNRGYILDYICKSSGFLDTYKIFRHFFSQKRHFPSIFLASKNI